MLFYKKYKNVVIAARDEKSYAFLKEKFENKIILSPDIVMSLEISNDNGANRKGVITLFRQDKEKSVSNELRVLIDEQVRQCYKDVEESDTVIEGEVSKKDRLIIALMLDLRTDFSLPCKLIAEEHFLYDSIFTRI